MTAFTTLPFCTWPSGEASFTLAVITSPNPARSPVEPPRGRIICNLRAPELSATSSMDLIITAMFVSPFALTDPPRYRRRLQLQAPEPSSVRYLSTSTASGAKADAIPRSARHRRYAFRSSRHARKTSCGSQSRARTSDALSCALLRPQSSFASCSRPPSRSALCGRCVFPFGPSFLPLLFLRLAGAQFLFAQNGFHARDVPAQPADLLQAPCLSHIHLELQLEQLIGQIPLLVLELHIRQITNLVSFHKSGLRCQVSGKAGTARSYFCNLTSYFCLLQHFPLHKRCSQRQLVRCQPHCFFRVRDGHAFHLK